MIIQVKDFAVCFPYEMSTGVSLASEYSSAINLACCALVARLQGKV